jgi:N-acetylglucosaminyl-diphospho-decaprenol L-rhamnosyltransferase
MSWVSSGKSWSAGADVGPRLKRPPPGWVAVIRGPQASIRAQMARDVGSRLTVVVVTYNSRAAVASSLPSIASELGSGDELVVVDNGSCDDTLAVVSELAPAATVIRNTGNAGFAAAANAGARAASGDLLVFLNPDATPAPGFGAAIRAPLARGWSAWMGLVTAARGRLVNTNGGVIHFTGIAWAGEAGAPAPGSLRGPRATAFVSGACFAVPRADWERVGGFAEEFFMYQEDVDLSLRLRLAGGALGVEPAAVVDHDYEFAKGSAKWRLLERNRWATIVRCYPTPLLAAVAPALAVTELALIAIAAFGGWLPEKLAAMGDTVRSLPRLLRERRVVQATRTVSAADFAVWLSPDLDSEYLGRARDMRPLRWALRAYWRLVLAALG